MQIIGNYFHNSGSDIPVVAGWETGFAAGFTFSGNHYYTDRTASQWTHIDALSDSLANFLADTGETGSSSDEKTIVEARSINTYQASLAATQTTAAFVASCLAQNKGSYDTDYDAERVVAYFKQGYRE